MTARARITPLWLHRLRGREHDRNSRAGCVESFKRATRLTLPFLEILNLEDLYQAALDAAKEKT